MSGGSRTLRRRPQRDEEHRPEHSAPLCLCLCLCLCLSLTARDCRYDYEWDGELTGLVPYFGDDWDNLPEGAQL